MNRPQIIQKLKGKSKIKKKKGEGSMGDKGKKDKEKHNKQVNIAKNLQNEAKRKKQEKAY